MISVCTKYNDEYGQEQSIFDNTNQEKNLIELEDAIKKTNITLETLLLIKEKVIMLLIES